MAGFDVSKYVDKDWQQAHSIDRPSLTCEVIQLANAVLGGRHQWIGSDSFQATVIAHTLLCSRCQSVLLASDKEGINFAFLFELANKVFLTQGEGMHEFLKNRYVIGSGQAVNVSCEEVQASLLSSFETGEPPESADDQAVYIAHILICRKCGEYLHHLSEGRKVSQSQENGASE